MIVSHYRGGLQQSETVFDPFAGWGDGSSIIGQERGRNKVRSPIAFRSNSLTAVRQKSFCKNHNSQQTKDAPDVSAIDGAWRFSQTEPRPLPVP